MKRAINYLEQKNRKTQALGLNNIILKTQWINEQLKKEIQQYMETKNPGKPKMCGMQKKCF